MGLRVRGYEASRRGFVLRVSGFGLGCAVVGFSHEVLSLGWDVLCLGCEVWAPNAPGFSQRLRVTWYMTWYVCVCVVGGGLVWPGGVGVTAPAALRSEMLLTPHAE